MPPIPKPKEALKASWLSTPTSPRLAVEPLSAQPKKAGTADWPTGQQRLTQNGPPSVGRGPNAAVAMQANFNIVHQSTVGNVSRKSSKEVCVNTQRRRQLAESPTAIYSACAASGPSFITCQLEALESPGFGGCMLPPPKEFFLCSSTSCLRPAGKNAGRAFFANAMFPHRNERRRTNLLYGSCGGRKFSRPPAVVLSESI